MFRFLNLLAIAQLIIVVFNYQICLAQPWNGYGRTTPVSLYKDDSGHENSFSFGHIESYMGYVEPNFYDAVNLPSPLLESRYSTYNLIIIINDNDYENFPEQWGPPQTMRVYLRNSENPGGLVYFWAISTGIDNASTKKGHYRPISFSSRHWSNQFDAPMLWSVFFDGGKALHSSMATSDLSLMGNTRSSHGCVHIEDHRARELFHLIGHSGYGLVNALSKSGKLILGSNKVVQKVSSYKTLIIIH